MKATTYLTFFPDEENATTMIGHAPSWERRAIMMFSFFGFAGAIGHSLGLY